MRGGAVVRRLCCTAVAALLAATAPSGGAGSDRIPGFLLPRHETEALLINALLDIDSNRLSAALATLERLLQISPNFRLAQLIKGDLLLARGRPLSGVGNAPSAPPRSIDELREEMLARLDRYRRPPPEGWMPAGMLRLSPQQTHAVVADLSQSRLYVFENSDGQPRYVTDYYISIGKAGYDKHLEGDKKTPLGVYFITASLPRSKLPDFYGAGAYPINYPNELDRREGRTGYGIWIHGVPSDTYSRPPRASDGCLALTNSDLDILGKNLHAGQTPVIIAQRLNWVAPEAARRQRDDLANYVEAWRRDWESLDADRYLAHYSPEFSAEGKNLAAWSAQKRRVSAGKEWVKVDLSNVSVFLDPAREATAVVTFDQQYSSNNLENRMKKRQYWKQEGGAWKIVFEGSA